MKRLLYTLFVCWLSCLCYVSPVVAGDEDMNPSVYQKFDPETGFMVPVNVNPTGQHNKHGTTAAQTTPTATDVNSNPGSSVAQTLPVAAAIDANSPPIPVVQPTSNDRSILWIGSLFVLMLAGGIVIFKRKRHKAV